MSLLGKLGKIGGGGGRCCSDAAQFGFGFRWMTSLSLQEPDKTPRPAPFPYEWTPYSEKWRLFDSCSHRFDENSKVIVVEGAHAVGKTEVAKHIAQEFGLKYFPPVNVNGSCYTTRTGRDMREFNHLLTDKNKPFAEMDFYKDPFSLKIPGATDRFFFKSAQLKIVDYILALRHLFNTGQGVVVEQSIFTDFIYLNAASNAGWVTKESKEAISFYHLVKCNRLLRPNLIVYLDADINTVRKNISARNNEWDKDSPVWNNSRYLNDVYSGMKHQFLPLFKDHSLILGYDWNEGGEKDLIVEDIERLNFDYYAKDETQQADWRMFTENNYKHYRLLYSDTTGRPDDLMNFNLLNLTNSPNLVLDQNDVYNRESILKLVPEERYPLGVNPLVGDNVFFKSKTSIVKTKTNPFYYVPWTLQGGSTFAIVGVLILLVGVEVLINELQVNSVPLNSYHSFRKGTLEYE